MSGRTNHADEIEALREHNSVSSSLAADLLEMHDSTSISLDNWENAREFVRASLDYIEYGEFELTENGA